MTSLIKNNIHHFFSKGIWIVLLTFSVYAVYLKGIAIQFNLTFFEFSILALTDHYYILYFLILSFLYFLYKFAESNKKIEDMILMRSKRFVTYFLTQVLSLLIISSLFVFLHVMISIVIGIGLRFENVFTTVPVDINTLITSEFERFFPTPLVSLFFIYLHMVLGLTLLGTLFIFLRQFLHPKVVIACIIVSYILMLLSIRSEVDSIVPFLFLNNYIVLHHAFVTLGENYYLLFIAELLLMVCMVMVIKRYWNKTLTISLSIPILDKWNLSMLLSKNHLVVMVVFVTIHVLSIILRIGDLTYFDLLTIQFYGHGTGYFHLIYFLSLVVYNGIPLYLLSYFLEKESADRSSFITIRLKHKKEWLFSILRSASIFIFTYIILTISISSLISFLFRLPFQGYEYMTPVFEELHVNGVKPLNLIGIIISSKFAELVFSFLFVFFLFCLTRTATTGFILLMASYMFCIFDTPIINYLPTGMSSLLRMKEIVGSGGISFFTTISILSMVTIGLYIMIRKWFFQRIF